MKRLNVYLNLSIFTVFLKNRNFISKIRISKVTDYAALRDIRKRAGLAKGNIMFLQTQCFYQCSFVLEKNMKNSP